MLAGKPAVARVVLLVIEKVASALSTLMFCALTGAAPVVRVNGAEAPRPMTGEGVAVPGTVPPFQLAADCQVPEALVEVSSARPVVRTVLPVALVPMVKPLAMPPLTAKVPLAMPGLPSRREARTVPVAFCRDVRPVLASYVRLATGSRVPRSTVSPAEKLTMEPAKLPTLSIFSVLPGVVSLKM